MKKFTKALHIADVGGSIFFNLPIIAYEKKAKIIKRRI